MTESPRNWQVERPDGTILGGLRWDVPQPRGLVYIAHGLAEHVARYDRFALALNQAGLAVAGHDHRGHKLSVTDPSMRGHFADRDGFRLMVEDLAAGMADWQDAHPDSPMVLFGHSMGSFMVQSMLTRGLGSYDMAILSGTAGPPPPLAAVGRLIARIQRAVKGARGTSRLIQSLAFEAHNKPYEPAPTKLEWLSRDRAEVDGYVADPWCGFDATIASWLSLFDGLPQLTSPAALKRLPGATPILLTSGENDPIGGNGDGVRKLSDLYQQNGVTDLTLTLYPDARHEILNETNRDQVMADIIGWIEARLKPSGA